jgi:hypothetical protein
MSEELKKVSLLNKTEKRAIVLKALNDAGFNDNQAAGLMEVSRQRVSVVQKGIKKGTLNPYVTKAKKAVKAILEGQLVGKAESIKTADILNAAKMVLDRADPVVQKLEQSHLHVNVEIKDEDRDRYRRALGVVVEAEFEPVPERKLIECESLPASFASPCLDVIPPIVELPPKNSESRESNITQIKTTDATLPLPLNSKTLQLQTSPIDLLPENPSRKDGESTKFRGPEPGEYSKSVEPIGQTKENLANSSYTRNINGSLS